MSASPKVAWGASKSGWQAMLLHACTFAQSFGENLGNRTDAMCCIAQGRLEPIATVFKQDNFGIGVDVPYLPRVTHFPQGPGPTTAPVSRPKQKSDRKRAAQHAAAAATKLQRSYRIDLTSDLPEDLAEILKG